MFGCMLGYCGGSVCAVYAGTMVQLIDQATKVARRLGFILKDRQEC